MALGDNVLRHRLSDHRGDRTLLAPCEDLQICLDRFVDEDGRALHERMIAYVCYFPAAGVTVRHSPS